MKVSHEIPHRVQGYFHKKARSGRESLVIGGFTLYPEGVSPEIGVSYVLPNHPNPILTPAAQERIERVSAKRGRLVCFQWLDSYAPGLGGQLTDAGYRLHEVMPLLICQPGQLRSPVDEPALEFVILDEDGSLEDLAEHWNINQRGFNPLPMLAEPADVAYFRSTLQQSRCFTARLDGVGVAAGMYTEVAEGVTELVGITTLAEYRRRGIGAALTLFAAQTAFANGVSLVFLTAANEEAGRVYQRVGFQPAGKLALMSKQM